MAEAGEVRSEVTLELGIMRDEFGGGVDHEAAAVAGGTQQVIDDGFEVAADGGETAIGLFERVVQGGNHSVAVDVNGFEEDVVRVLESGIEADAVDVGLIEEALE
jgi:hypothetical protein